MCVVFFSPCKIAFKPKLIHLVINENRNLSHCRRRNWVYWPYWAMVPFEIFPKVILTLLKFYLAHVALHKTSLHFQDVDGPGFHGMFSAMALFISIYGSLSLNNKKNRKKHNDFSPPGTKDFILGQWIYDLNFHWGIASENSLAPHSNELLIVNCTSSNIWLNSSSGFNLGSHSIL